MRIWRGKRPSGVDLEHELRAQRARPRDAFLESVVAGLSAQPARTRFGRFGVALAMTGLIVVAVASFGGIGYASGGSTQRLTSSADAQYAPVKPPPKKKPAKSGTAGVTAAKPPTKPSSGLPFTGLNLWLPMAGGIVLVVLGLGLRWQGRRRPAAE